VKAAPLNELRLPDAKRPTVRWAARVLSLWAAAGWPALVGPAAEKVHLARRILGV
jgi:hypothetical protein